jgi:hypothetical protein
MSMMRSESTRPCCSARRTSLSNVLEVAAVEEAGEAVRDGQGLQGAVRVAQAGVDVGQLVARLLQALAAFADALGHVVERAGEVRDLVVAAHGQVDVEVAGGHSLGPLGEEEDRAQQLPRADEVEDRDHEGGGGAGQDEAAARLLQRLERARTGHGGDQPSGEGAGEVAQAEHARPQVGQRPLGDDAPSARGRDGAGRDGERAHARILHDLSRAGEDVPLRVQQPGRGSEVGGVLGEHRLHLAEVEALHEVAKGAPPPLRGSRRRNGAQQELGGTSEELGLAQGADQHAVEGDLALHERTRPVLELLLARAREHPPLAVHDEERLVHAVVPEEGGQVRLQVAGRARLGRLLREGVEPFVDDEGSRPARGFLRAVSHPVVEGGLLAQEVAGEAVFDLLAQDLAVAPQEEEAQGEDGHRDAKQDDGEQLGLHAETEGTRNGGLGHAPHFPGEIPANAR